MPARERAHALARSLHLFVFSFLAQCLSLFNWGANLFIVMETISENLRHMTTSKPKVISEGPQGEGARQIGDEACRQVEEMKRGESDQRTTTSNLARHIREDG